MPILDLNSIKVQSKWNAFWSKAKDKAIDAAYWIKNNPETVGIITTLGAAIIGGTVKIGKGMMRTHNLRKEQYIKERNIYDRSLGMYLHTRRPLRNKDFVTINARRNKGERLSDILIDMNILD